MTPYTSPDLFRGLVEGHGCVDQFEPVFHLEHELLPVRGHVLSTVSNHVRVIVIGLQESFGFLLDLEGALMGLLQREGKNVSDKTNN